MTRSIPAFVEPVTDTRQVTVTLNDNDLIMIRQLLHKEGYECKEQGRSNRFEWIGDVTDKINHALFPEKYGV